jgi:putative transposase
MKKGKHTEEQIIGVLKQVEAGRTVKEVARELGVSEATIYTWKSKYGGMEVSEATYGRRQPMMPCAGTTIRDGLRGGSNINWLIGRRMSRWLGIAAHAVTFPVVLGFLPWALSLAPDGWQFERTPHYPTPAYLLTEGPYRYSCNPMYVTDGLIFIGWIAFYGSLVLLVVIAAVALLLGPFIVPREERGLEARFGDTYRKYRRTTPRWFGKARL